MTEAAMHTLVHDMFMLPIPVLEKLIRPVLVYIFLVLLLRVFGKRELAQLNPFDFVVLISLSNTVQNAIIGDDNSVAGGFVGAFALMLCNYLVVRFLFRHRRLDQIIEGEAAVLIKDGKVLHKNLARELITVSELDVVARRQGFDGVGTLDECVIEPGGTFVMKSKEPTRDDARYAELVKMLGELSRKVDALKT
jgi:uncharacterized membrane protein YcaP (DUF421 family)